MSELDDFELNALVDNQLNAEAEDRIRTLLLADATASERLRLYMLQKRQLSEALTEQTLEPMPAETERLIRQLQRGQTAARRRHMLRENLRGAAVVVIVLGAGWWGHVLYDKYAEAAVPPLVEDAAQAHEIFAEDPVRPVELPGSEQDELAAWFTDHLGEVVTVPDLRILGLRLVGGRLLGTDEGSPMAQLLYEDARHNKLSLNLSQASDDGSPPVRIVEVGGLTAGYWQHDGLAFALVAETPADRLLAVASEISEPAEPARF